MAEDRATIRIDADVSRVEDGAQRARRALGAFGETVKQEDQTVTKFGNTVEQTFSYSMTTGFKRLPKATRQMQDFDNAVSNAGRKTIVLRDSLDKYEMPLRDIEGSFDRVSMATRVWGNSSETASEKATTGFLLAADSIATFSSGGIAGVAIAAAIAGFSLLSKAIDEEAEAARKAEEITKKQAEALDQLAQSALTAGLSIMAQEGLERVTEESKNLLKVDKDLVENRREQIKLLREQGREDLAIQKANKAGLLFNEEERINLRTTRTERKEASTELQRLRVQERALTETLTKAEADLEKAAGETADERARFSDSVVSRIIGNASKIADSLEQVREKVRTAEKAQHRETEAEVMTRYAAESKAREDQQKALREEDEAFDQRQRERQDAARERFKQRLKENRDETLAKLDADKEAARSAEDSAKKRMDAFQKAHSVEIAAVSATIGALQQMAHDGEISFSKLADAAVTAAGNQLVADGTKVLMSGVAKLFNPVTAAIGGAEAAQGGLMISAGLGMGAVGGFIGRSGAATTPANAAASSAPTDTRESRSAASSGDSGGGTTIVNFNGPAYDRRAVGQVINSGMKMARHRRIAGA